MSERTRFAWAKLNAYGIILAGLAFLGIRDLIKPGGANLAVIVGEVPPGQYFWVTGYVLSGAVLVYSFARGDRLAETVGLGLLLGSLLLQTAVAYHLLGWSDFTLTRLVLIGIIGLGGGARLSALWSRNGLIVTIPPRGQG